MATLRVIGPKPISNTKSMKLKQKKEGIFGTSNHADGVTNEEE